MKNALWLGQPKTEDVTPSLASPAGEGLADLPADRDGTLAQLTEWVHYLSDQLMHKERHIQQLQKDLERSWAHRLQRWWLPQRK